MSGTVLTLRPFFWWATKLFQEKEVVSRTHGGVQRYTYGDVRDRVPALAAGLVDLGVGGRQPCRDARLEPPPSLRGVYRCPVDERPVAHDKRPAPGLGNPVHR